MIEGIAFAHEHGVKVYVTANILAHNRDLEGVRAYFEELKKIKPDALIIAGSGRLYAGKGVSRRSSDTLAPGQQYQLPDLSVLVSAGRETSGVRQRAFHGRTAGAAGAYSG